MNLNPKLKKIFSGTLSFTVFSTLLLNFPVQADDINEKYPYTMFAASEYALMVILLQMVLFLLLLITLMLMEQKQKMLVKQ